MTAKRATVTRIHEHHCPFVLWTASGWVSASTCHFGQPVQQAAPVQSRRVA